MPPYIVVETYMPCPDGELPALASRFHALLARLGYVNDEDELWRTEMGWDDEDDWYGPTACPEYPVHDLAVTGNDLRARASILGWSVPTIPGLSSHWISFELYFETEREDQYLVTASVFSSGLPATYIVGVGHAMWRVMRAFANEFPDHPVYCTLEGNEGNAWEAIETGRGDLWSFDAALIPPDYVLRFSPVPDTYIAAPLPEGFALAARKFWIAPPWDEVA